MSQAASASDQGPALLALYDSALPQVYGYLVRRCDGTTVAEDLTAETFLAAVAAVQKGSVPQMTTAWLIGVARHKLVDHWRRQARDERNLRGGRPTSPPPTTTRGTRSSTPPSPTRCSADSAPTTDRR